MSDLSDKLMEVATIMTPLVLDATFSHMKKPWEMLMGGLLIPVIIKEDKSAFEGNEQFEALMEKYSKENVIKFFNPEPTVLETVKTVVEKERVIVNGERKETTHEPVKIGGKFRRLKGSVAKDRKQVRELMPEDRDLVNLWWNKEQRLVPKDDPICEMLCTDINNLSLGDALAPYQVAGYISYLCRLALMSDVNRDKNIQRTLKRGNYTVAPLFTPELLKTILVNYEENKKDEKIREEAKALMRAGKGMVESTPVTPAPVQQAPVSTVQPQTVIQPVEAEPVDDGIPDIDLGEEIEITYA